MSRSSLESIAETSCPLPPATFPGKPQLPTIVTAVQESLGLQPQEGKEKILPIFQGNLNLNLPLNRNHRKAD